MPVSKRSKTRRAPWRSPWAVAFWNRAYKENITGLAGMVAYNLMLAIFPFALLVLFVFGQIVDSPEIEESVILDIQRLFPDIEQTALENAIDRVRDSSTTIGVAAVVGGALDRGLLLGRDGHRLLPDLPRRVPRLGRPEALRAGDAGGPDPPARRQRRRPDHRERGARRQPTTCRGASTSSAPSGPRSSSSAASSPPSLIVQRRSTGPCRRATCRGARSGRARSSSPPRSRIANYVFPFYLTSVSDLNRIGGTIGFILVALIWFYASASGCSPGP